MKIVKAMTVTAMLALFPLQASAGDYEVQNVMDDSLYGAGVGALVGLGIALVSNRPSDHWNYITRGAGFGIIAGAGYGLFRSSKAFAEVEDGQIHLGMPSPEVAFQDTAAGLDMVVKTDLIRGHF